MGSGFPAESGIQGSPEKGNTERLRQVFWKMISAILLAGYNNKREVKKYSRTVAEHYGEKFIEAGFKPLRVFKTV